MKNEELRRETKDKIFIEAAELFSRNGYYKVSVREICEAAGVTKPVLYYYFIDKENLLMEMVKETQRVVERLINKWISPDSTIEQKLKGIIHLYIEFIEQYPHLVRFSTFIQLMVVPDDVKKFKMQQAEKSWFQFYEMLKNAQATGSLKQNIEITELARNFMGSIIVIVSEYILIEYPIDELKNRFFKFLDFWKQEFVITKN